MESNWKPTNWQYSTSEDHTGSLFLSFSYGKIILKNIVSKDLMRIKYKILSIGLSKGLPFGISTSTFDTDSSGSRVTSLVYFDENVFPCGGYIFSAGFSFGAIDSETGPPDPAFANGLSAALVVFGEFPAAKVSCYGGTAGTTPGVGGGVGLAWFSLEEPSS